MTKKPCIIKKSVISELLFNSISDIEVGDLGWWLECETDNEYTIIEYEFLRDTFSLLDAAGSLNSTFKTKWFNSLDTLKNRGLR